MGNVVGSAISNILGAFSLGLLFHDGNEAIRFDRSSRIYSIVLLVLTTFALPGTYVEAKTARRVCGSLLIASFAVYIVSVGWAIRGGALTAPEDSDSDSEDSDSSDDGESSSEATTHNDAVAGRNIHIPQHSNQTTPCLDTATTPLLPSPPRRRHHTLKYHTSHLFLSFLTLCLAGFVLSHAATAIIDSLHLSDALFGIVVLAIATTLPEKFVAVMSARRGHTGVLTANTAGSNIFLLTLCSGIVMLDGRGSEGGVGVGLVELGVLWGSTVVFTATVWFGARFCRAVACVMVVAYVAFIVLELVVVRGGVRSG
jgi:Ca2+/Na+ antiporter